VKRPNAWQEAILAQLRAADGPLTVDQIWQRMAAEGFQHSSKMPRSTLGASVAELAKAKQLERVGRATYRIASSTEASA
jgi:hypothetical protein